MPELSAELLQLFVREILTRTGIVIRPQDYASLTKKLYQRLRSRRLDYFEPYATWLFQNLATLNATERSQREQEWQALIQQISITESYFFRDQGQFRLLRELILPRLIAEKRQRAQAMAQRPQLKIWSAACSTGEEPYSLAIVVIELLEDLQDWDLTILGTDINEAALESARCATYSEWSFRQVEQQYRDRYFRKQGEISILSTQIAKLVRFQPLNLASSTYPNPELGLSDIDLILCRNVFIYLDSDTITTILARMAQTLQPNGYLLTAHAELQHHNLGQFQAQLCPESVVYQRRDATVAPLTMPWCGLTEVDLGAVDATATTSQTSTLPTTSGASPVFSVTSTASATSGISTTSAASTISATSATSTASTTSATSATSTASTTSGGSTTSTAASTISPFASGGNAARVTSGSGLRSTTSPPQQNSGTTQPFKPLKSTASPISSPISNLSSNLNANPIAGTARPVAPESPIMALEQRLMSEAIAHFQCKAYTEAIAILDQLLAKHPQHFAACDLIAYAYANLGQYNQASYYCSQALNIDSFATSPHYLMAHLAELNGNINRAKTLLKRVVYLDPQAALAYLELASLYRSEQDLARAAKMEQAARELLLHLAPNQPIAPHRSMTAQELLGQLNQGQLHSPANSATNSAANSPANSAVNSAVNSAYPLLGRVLS